MSQLFKTAPKAWPETNAKSTVTGKSPMTTISRLFLTFGKNSAPIFAMVR